MLDQLGQNRILDNADRTYLPTLTDSNGIRMTYVVFILYIPCSCFSRNAFHIVLLSGEADASRRPGVALPAAFS